MNNAEAFTIYIHVYQRIVVLFVLLVSKKYPFQMVGDWNPRTKVGFDDEIAAINLNRPPKTGCVLA